VIRSRLVVFLGLALAGIGGASLFTSGASAQNQTVDVGNLYFCSPSFSGQVCDTGVNVGDTVTWNVSAGFHTVTECDESFATCPPAGGFDSGQLEVGGTFSRTFTAAGTFEYYCAFHPTEMRGRVVVSASAVQPTPVPTAAPTSPGATAAPTTAGAQTRTVTPAAVPNTGGSPGNGSDSLSWLLTSVLGAALLAGAAGFGYAALKR
jgi:plastocyanin